MASGKTRKAVPAKLRALLQKEIDSRCPFCGNEEVEHFVLHHIDEDRSNTVQSNLLMICTICHSKIHSGDITESEVRQKKLYPQNRSEQFPGPKVAEAWVHSVINPFIYALEDEKNSLEKEHWGIDIYRPNQLRCVTMFLERSISGNCEQFLRHDAEIHDQIQIHDVHVQSLVSAAFECLGDMYTGSRMNRLYEKATSLESLVKLKDENVCPEHYDFRECEVPTDYVRKLFSKDDVEKNTKLLLQCIINQTPKGSEYRFAPLWNLYREQFLAERDSAFIVQIRRFRGSSSVALKSVEEFLEILKNKRNALCQKYDLPFEEHRRTVVQAPSYLPRY